MQVGEIAVGLRLDDGQVQSSTPRVEALLDRLDRTVTRLAESMEGASQKVERLGSATRSTADSIGSTAGSVGKAAAAIGLAGIAVANSSLSLASAAGAFSRIGEVAREAGKRVSDAFSSAGRAVGTAAGKINSTVIQPSAAPFQKFLHDLLAPAHLAQAAIIFGFEAMSHSVGTILQNMSRTAGLAIVGFWGTFAATIGKSAIQVAGDVEVIKQRLFTLTGSMDAAKGKLHFFDELAKRSQFKLPDLVDAGTQLEVLGITAEAMLPLVGDLASAMGQDLTGMARAVGRALKGIPEGFEVLRNQAGVTVEALVKAGAVMRKEGGLDLSTTENKRKAAEALLAIMERMKGGMARKAEGIQGSLAKVANAFYNLNKAVGEQLAPLVKTVSLRGAEIVNSVAGWVDGLNQAGTKIGEWAASLSLGGLAISALGMAIGGLLSWLGGLAAAALSAASVLWAIGVAGAFIAGALTSVIPAMAPVAAGLGTLAAVAFTAKLAIVAIGTVVGGALLTAFAAGAAAIAVFSVAWARDWGGIREKAAAGVEWTKNVILNGFDSLFTSATSIWGDLSKWIGDTAEGLYAEIAPGVTAVVELFREEWPAIKSIASDVIEGVTASVKGLGLFLQFEMGGIALAWRTAWGVLKDVVAIAWPLIAGIVRQGITTVQTALRVGLNLLKGQWGEAWDALMEGVRGSKNNLVAAVNEALAAALQQVLDFVKTFGLAGEAIGEALVSGIESASARARSARFDSTVMTAMKAGGKPSAWDNMASYVAGLGQRDGTPGKKGAEPDFDFQKWWKEFLAGIQGGAEGDDKDKKTHKPSQAEIERQERLRLVAAARSRIGVLHVEPNQCAMEVRKAVEISGLAGRGPFDQVAPVPFDARALPAGAPYGKGYADSLPGSFFRDISKLQIGDWVVFQNTSGDGGPGAASHIGTVVEIGENGDIRMVDTSSAAAPSGASSRVVERSINAFRPDQLLGFVKPSIFGGSQDLGGGSGEFSQILADQQKVGDFLRAAGEFEKSRQQVENEFRDALEAARKLRMGAQAEKALEAERASKLAEVDRHERESIQLLRDSWLRTKLEAASQDPVIQVLDAVQALEAARTELLDKMPTLGKDQQAEARGMLEALQGVEEFRSMIPALLEGKESEVERIMAALSALPDGNQVRAAYEAIRTSQEGALEGGLTLATQPDAERWEEQRAMADEAIAALQRRRELHRITAEEELGALAQILNAYQGSEADKEALQIAYAGKVQESLTRQLEALGLYHEAELAKMEEHLVAKGELLASEEATLAAVREMRNQLHLQDLQEQQQFLDSIGNSFQQFMVQTMSAQTSFAQTFQNLWKSLANAVISEIARMMIKTAAFQALLIGLRRLLGGIFGFVGGTGGGAGAELGGLVKVHTGGLVTSSGIQKFHDGGIVGPQMRPDEVLALLQTGEMVLSRRDTRGLRNAQVGGEQAVTVNVGTLNNNGPQDVITMARDLGRRTAWYLQEV